jgi:general secretion pathway protein F
MPLYKYKGIVATTGSTKKGRIEADNVRAAKQKLKQKDGILVSEIVEDMAGKVVKASSSGAAVSANDSFWAKLTAEKVKIQDISVMTRQFATLQNAHVPLDECLKALTEQVENLRLSATLAQIKDSVSEGRDLSAAMKDYPDIFSKLYINMVAAGESAGTLGLVLDRVADFMEYRVKVRGQIISAITYPLLMMFASSAVVMYLFLAVVPKLSKVFADLKVDLPWYTKLLVESAQFIQNYWILIIIVIGGIALMIKRWAASDKGRRKVDRWALKLPFFGGVVLRISVGQFTETLSTLLNAGVPIVAALEITKNVVGNTLVQGILKRLSKKVLVLGVLSKSLKFFHPLLFIWLRRVKKPVSSSRC